MIIRGGKEIIEYYYGKIPLTEMYIGKHLIWELIRSCFGSGYWAPDSPWISEDVWRNN
jgi:hypothetical protein